MTVRKIGKAKALPDSGFWEVDQKPDRFLMSPRLVEARPDVKALKKIYSKHASKSAPSKKKVKDREDHHQHRKDLRLELDELIAKVYAEVLKESFTEPVPLRKASDTDHGGDWRYCLYEGIVYQFDRPGYLTEDMREQITASKKPAQPIKSA